MPMEKTCLPRRNSELHDEVPMRVHVYFLSSLRVILIVSVSHFSDFPEVLSMFHYYSVNFMVAEWSSFTSIFIRKDIWTHMFMQFFQRVVKIYAILEFNISQSQCALFVPHILSYLDTFSQERLHYIVHCYCKARCIQNMHDTEP